MKVLARREGLAIPATVATANLPQGTVVSISGNATVDKAAADGMYIGNLRVPAKTANGKGTVETRFKELVECEADGSITAGTRVKLGALSPTTGLHTVKTWVEGTDALSRLYGVAWVGGSDEATVQVLTY